MTAKVYLVDAQGSEVGVRVSSIGQLTVAPFSYDETMFIELAEADTAYSFYKPKNGQKFVITGIRAKADRQVSTNADAEVIIYESSAPDTVVVDKVLHQEAMVQGDSATLGPLNILVNTGKWVNAKTSDDDIHMTITGYYIPI